MWLVSENGFISVVEWSPKKDKLTGRVKLSAPYAKLLSLPEEEFWFGDSNTLSSHLLVRARVRADLVPLEEYDPFSVFTEDPTADYRYRLVARRTYVAQYLADLAMGIDYNSHVKEVVRDRAPATEHGSRYNGMMDIWSATAKWQRSIPYTGIERSTVTPTTYQGLSSYTSSSGWLDKTSTATYGKVFTDYETDWVTGEIVDFHSVKEALQEWVVQSVYGDNSDFLDWNELTHAYMDEFGLCSPVHIADADIDKLIQDNLSDILEFDPNKIGN